MSLFISFFLIYSMNIFHLSAQSRIQEVRNRMSPDIQSELHKLKLELGNEVYLRAFKHERVLELWMKPQKSEKYILYKQYSIVAMSGRLGPKLKEGDYQAPEVLCDD